MTALAIKTALLNHQRVLPLLLSGRIMPTSAYLQHNIQHCLVTVPIGGCFFVDYTFLHDSVNKLLLCPVERYLPLYLDLSLLSAV